MVRSSHNLHSFYASFATFSLTLVLTIAGRHSNEGFAHTRTQKNSPSPVRMSPAAKSYASSNSFSRGFIQATERWNIAFAAEL